MIFKNKKKKKIIINIYLIKLFITISFKNIIYTILKYNNAIQFIMLYIFIDKI